MTHANTAVQTFDKGFNCAQSVFSSFAAEMHIDPDLALKLGTGFGGGLARKQHVCGAVSGGIMILSLMHGRGAHDDMERTDQTYVEVRALIDAFVKEHGTINCGELLSGCSLLTDEGRKRFKEDNLVERCREYIQTVCNILDIACCRPASPAVNAGSILAQDLERPVFQYAMVGQPSCRNCEKGR